MHSFTIISEELKTHRNLTERVIAKMVPVGTREHDRNRKQQEDADHRIWCAFRGYVLEHLDFPSISKLSKLAQADFWTVKPRLEALIQRFELLRKQENSFIHLYNLHSRPFSLRSSRTVNDASALMRPLFQSDVYRVTLTTPSDTEESHLALCAYSDQIIKQLVSFIKALLPASHHFWIWCWELQQRGALHLHLDIPIPFPLRETFIKEVKEQWIACLQFVSDTSGFNLFQCRDEDGVVYEVSQEEIYVDMRAAHGDYLGKMVGKEPRVLASFENLLATPHRWAGVSRSLSSQVKSSRLMEVIPVASVAEGFKLIADLKKLLLVTDWNEHTSYNGYLLGFRAHLDFENYDRVRSILRKEAKRLCGANAALVDCPHRLILELDPSRHICLKVTTSWKLLELLKLRRLSIDRKKRRAEQNLQR